MNTLVIGMSDRMARAVTQATDILHLPTNQDFALKAMGLMLRSMGLAPATGRPIGYSQRRHTQKRTADKRQQRALTRRAASGGRSR